MKQDGVIQRVGSDRKGYWDIKKKVIGKIAT